MPSSPRFGGGNDASSTPGPPIGVPQNTTNNQQPAGETCKPRGRLPTFTVPSTAKDRASSAVTVPSFSLDTSTRGPCEWLPPQAHRSVKNVVSTRAVTCVRAQALEVRSTVRCSRNVRIRRAPCTTRAGMVRGPALALMLYAAAAHADPEGAGEVIVVSCSRLAEPSMDEAASVDAISRDELDRSPARLAADVLRARPEVGTFRRRSSALAAPTSQGHNLRGVGPSGVSRALVLQD